MTDTAPRLSGLPLAASRLVVLGVAALNGWLAVAIAFFREGAFTDYPGSLGVPLAVLTISGLAASVIASGVAVALVLRGGRRRSAHALALALASATFAALAFLHLLTPWPHDRSPVRPAVWVFAGDVWWVFILVAAAGFVRFSVLFPRPLTESEARSLGKVEVGDSLSRIDRVFKRIGATLLRRSGRGESSESQWIDRLTDRLPEPLRQWAARPVFVDAARWLTDPWRFWTGVAVMALIPPLAVRVPALVAAFVGGPVLADHPAQLVVALVLFTWGLLVVMAAPILGVAVLRLGYGLAGESDRRRMRWIVESLNAAVWVLFVPAPFVLLRSLGVENPIPAFLPAVLGGIIPLIVVTGFAVAIFYDGALEPRLVIRKSTLYGLFGFGLAFLFAVTEELVTNHMTAQLGLPDGTGTLVASGVIAVVFGAFHGRFSRKVESWLSDEEADEVVDRQRQAGL